MQRNAKRAWIVVAIVAAGGSFAACDARMHVLDAAEQVALGAGGTGGQGAGGSEGVGGAGCDVADDGGTRTGDAREVRDMTPDEATQWCNNFFLALSPFVPSPGVDIPSMFPGYVDGQGAPCWSNETCIFNPSLDDCVTNLLHAPCEATIVSLNTCVSSMIGDNFVNPNCAAGCEAFIHAPHCSETIVSKVGPPIPNGGGGAGECYLRTSPGCR
jgi:hypothetical protein